MKRTISAMVGKGSVNHNSRQFTAENVNADRSHLNISYCNIPIKQVYHELFDDALERFNAKQTRSDRRIDNYYEKIRTGKQEKPFHELILQIGNKDDTGADTDTGEKAKGALDEYYQGFQQRNPNLRVFSAHLHMDEATPHIHIDFVPYITGSKRGLDTRVSLKQALAAQGFKGGTRSATEWTQWVQSEKEQLAHVMERHGFEWEQKGTHEQHLDVLDYKKQVRSQEVAEIETNIAEKKQEFTVLADRVNNLNSAVSDYEEIKHQLTHDPEYQLPEPPALMTAKTYKTKFVEPLIKKLKSVIKKLLVRNSKIKDALIKITDERNRLQHDNDKLSRQNQSLREENDLLRLQSSNYNLLQKALGKDYIELSLAKFSLSSKIKDRIHTRPGQDI